MLKKMLFGLLLAAQSVPAQDIPWIKAGEIGRWKDPANDTVYVVNFWATWCQPCIAELPAFERLNAEFAGRPVQVILVSTDFKRDVEKRLKPFVREKQLRSRVVFMDEPNPNTWINAINPDWSGAIPATLIVAQGRGVERFFEGGLSYEELLQATTAALEK